MAKSLTRGSWDVSTLHQAGKDFVLAKCTVQNGGSSEDDIYTKPIDFLKSNKKFYITANPQGTSIGASGALDIWISPYTTGEYGSMDMYSFAASVAVTSNGASSGSSVGWELKATGQGISSGGTATYVYDPSGSSLAAFPTLWLNLDIVTTATSAAKSVDFIVMQEA